MVDAESQSRGWFVKADHDWRSASVLISLPDPITDTAAFHCQQAAEKLLKGYLTFHAMVFEKTHDLRRLCRLCESVDASFNELIEQADCLTDYAVHFRYPGDPDPTMEDLRQALEIVQIVWKFVMDRLPETARMMKSADNDR